MLYPPNGSPKTRMPLKRKKKKKMSRDSIELLFEDMLQQVEHGVHRMEALERDLKAEKTARAADARKADAKLEASGGVLPSVGAPPSRRVGGGRATAESRRNGRETATKSTYN